MGGDAGTVPGGGPGQCAAHDGDARRPVCRHVVRHALNAHRPAEAFISVIMTTCPPMLFRLPALFRVGQLELRAARHLPDVFAIYRGRGPLAGVDGGLPAAEGSATCWAIRYSCSGRRCTFSRRGGPCCASIILSTTGFQCPGMDLIFNPLAELFCGCGVHFSFL